jgi:hypothetical protein
MARYKGRPTKRQLALWLAFWRSPSYSSYYCLGEADSRFEYSLRAIQYGLTRRCRSNCFKIISA